MDALNKVKARVTTNARAKAPDPLVVYDLSRLDGADVALPPGPPATASPALLAATALARATGRDVREVEAMTPDEVRALAATTDA